MLLIFFVQGFLFATFAKRRKNDEEKKPHAEEQAEADTKKKQFHRFDDETIVTTIHCTWLEAVTEPEQGSFNHMHKFISAGKHRIKALIGVVVCVFVNSSWSANANDFAARLESNFVLPLVEQSPGGALVVVDRGQVVLERTYGVKAWGGQDAVTPTTLFRIASLSKTFASAAASMLVDDTSLTWHTPLKANLGDVRFKNPQYGARINLKHLMSQSTGLMPHAYTNLIEENMSYQRILDRLDRVDFVCEPGKCYGYQNVVFSLVGDLVEKKTTVDYPTYVAKRLFQPLGMQRASFGLDAFKNDPNHATPHVWTGKRWRPVNATHHYYKVPPAAGVNASITDLKIWLLAQLGHQPDVLPENMLKEMHKGHTKTSRLQAHYPRRKPLGDVFYGLGWRTFDYGKQKGYVHHGGYVRGMCSTMVFHPESGSGMVLLINGEPRGMNELVLDFAELHNDAVQQPVMISRR